MEAQASSQESLKRSVPLPFQVALFAIISTIVNTGFRMAYPFLPVFASELRVSSRAIEQAITIRNLLGILSPLFGSTADVRGRRFAMLLGLGIFTGSLAVVVFMPTYLGLLIGFVGAGIGKLFYNAAIYGYLGDNVPYERRGLALGLTEMGWAGAYFLGMPLIGWLIARNGWAAPFPILAGLGLLSITAIWWIIPSDHPVRAEGEKQRSIKDGLQIVLGTPSARATLSFSFLIALSSEIVNVSYATWLKGSFGLQVAALGLTGILIGLTELAGEGLVSGLSDRLGKKRSLALAAALYIIGCFALPFLGQFGQNGALAGLMVFYLGFEYTIVATVPLNTEIVPQARATLLATNFAFLSIGRTVGSFIAMPVVFVPFGIWGVGLFCALINFMALAVLLNFIKQD